LRSAARDAQQRGACYGAAQLLEQALSVSENLSEKDRGSMKKEISVELKMIREAMNQKKPRAARADRSLTISG
jgi:hypothetical protein